MGVCVCCEFACIICSCRYGWYDCRVVVVLVWRKGDGDKGIGARATLCQRGERKGNREQYETGVGREGGNLKNKFQLFIQSDPVQS